MAHHREAEDRAQEARPEGKALRVASISAQGRVRGIHPVSRAFPRRAGMLKRAAYIQLRRNTAHTPRHKAAPRSSRLPSIKHRNEKALLCRRRAAYRSVCRTEAILHPAAYTIRQEKQRPRPKAVGMWQRRGAMCGIRCSRICPVRTDPVAQERRRRRSLPVCLRVKRESCRAERLPEPLRSQNKEKRIPYREPIPRHSECRTENLMVMQKICPHLQPAVRSPNEPRAGRRGFPSALCGGPYPQRR